MNNTLVKGMHVIVATSAFWLTACAKPQLKKQSSAPSRAELEGKSQAPKKPEVSALQTPNPSIPPSSSQKQESKEEDGLILKARNTSLTREDRLSAITKLADIDTEASTRGLVDLIGITAKDDEDKRISATSSVGARYPAVAAIKSRGAKATPLLIERLFALVANGGDPTEIRLVCMTALSLEKIDSINQHLDAMETASRYQADVVAHVRKLLISFASRFPQNK